MQETDKLKMLMHSQFRLNFIRLDNRGRPMPGSITCAPRDAADKAGLGADIAANAICKPGLTPFSEVAMPLAYDLCNPSGEGCLPIAGSEREKFRVEIPCQFRVTPYAAVPDKLTAALVPVVATTSLGELKKTVKKSGLIDLVAAQNESPARVRAAYAEADEIMAAYAHSPWDTGDLALAIRGAPAIIGYQHMAVVLG